MIQQFAVDQVEAFAKFLESTPRALVLFRGTHCPYSATLRPYFEKAAASGRQGTFAIRDLDEGRDPEWEHHGIEVTPTVICFQDGAETSRLEGVLLLGITRQKLEKWLASL